MDRLGCRWAITQRAVIEWAAGELRGGVRGNGFALHLEVILGDPRSVIGCTLAANQLSSLLRELHKCAETMARREGFEPPTLRFEEESEPEEDQ